jgi:hypothetical protein
VLAAGVVGLLLLRVPELLAPPIQVAVVVVEIGAEELAAPVVLVSLSFVISGRKEVVAEQ